MVKMRNRMYQIITIILCLVTLITVGAVNAEWTYPSYPEDHVATPMSLMNNFKFGQIYITDITITDGTYARAEFTKTSETKMTADLALNNNASSSVTVNVTFYNSTSVSYFYDKVETLSYDNETIIFTVSGIAQKEEIPSNTYKTITLTFNYDGAISASALLSELNFKFTVDKDSIDDLVAETAVERFEDILNDVVQEDSYSQLTEAMNDRGSAWNKGSAVTYIGNVAGADSGDSAVILSLFGEAFMQEDLDGDGNDEPITMMIKRENLDDDISTGDDYTYAGTWGNQVTVQGVELTLYITAQQIGNADIVVYATTYTRLAGSDEWVQVVPLTKGTASTNNYNGWGAVNSFNTDTWRSDSNETIEQLVAKNPLA